MTLHEKNFEEKILVPRDPPGAWGPYLVSTSWNFFKTWWAWSSRVWKSLTCHFQHWRISWRITETRVLCGRLFNILTCFIKSYKEFLLRIASKVLVSQQYLSSKTGLIYLNYVHVHVHVQFWATNWCFGWLWMVKMKSYMLRINVGRHF